MAQRNMSEHDGNLCCQPCREDGDCFVLQLPRIDEPATVAAVSTPAASWGPSNKKNTRPARILILDDERALGEMLGQLVRHLGHQSTLCFSPLEALRHIEHGDFDLIFSDYRMPVLDGRQFYERVARLKPYLLPRIVFLTGDVASEDTQDFLGSISNACITKPFHLRTVAGTINTILRELKPLAGSLQHN
jgi:CheY-like chemotaxis protein